MMAIPLPLASFPNPADGERDVPTDEVLSWRPAGAAYAQDVYLGTAFENVRDAERDDSLGVLGDEPGRIRGFVERWAGR
ncbi:MAG: hypothetical protein P8Z79_02145 [Sedimentisphaerales bacterium]